jgi:hypothetical protein
MEIGDRISRPNRRKLAANLPRAKDTAPVDLMQPHTVSFFAA